MDRGNPASHAEEFADALERLKRTGGVLLVAGETPETTHRLACDRMLGSTDQPRVLLRTDRTCAVDPGSADRVVALDVAARSTATEGSTDGGPSGPGGPDGPEGPDGTAEPADTPGAGHEPTVVGTVPAFGSAAAEAIEAADATDPSSPRVCLDSVLPLTEAVGAERAFQACHVVAATAREAGSVCHVHAPVGVDDEPAATFAGLADATVELRLAGDRPQQRWRIHDPQVSSTWLPLDRD